MSIVGPLYVHCGPIICPLWAHYMSIVGPLYVHCWPITYTHLRVIIERNF